ncbi:MAG TPA: PAS domain-containing protein [Bryobacteraceae bacterium]|jgi:PAS domain S-box-containing protein|nr:PAS domain-containing protein [Bryobacteraceae bacterium]
MSPNTIQNDHTSSEQSVGKCAEWPLGPHADLLEAILEGTPDPIFVKDLDGRFIVSNSANARLFHLSRNAFVGLRDFDLLAPRYAEPIVAVDKRVLATGETEVVEERIADDGQERVYLATKSALRDANGRIVGLIGIARDITDRKHAESALIEANREIAQREEQFRMVANAIPQLAWMADAQGSRFWFNERWFQYTSSVLQEVKGWGWLKLVDPDHAQRVDEHFRRCIASGEVWDDTFPLRGAGGRYRWFLDRAIPLRDAAGNVMLWFGTGTDITERKFAEDALRKANDELDHFASMVAHDLQEPLRNIVMFSQLLQRHLGEELDADAQKFLDFTLEGAQRMSRLITDILAYSRATGERGSLDQEVDLEAALFDELAALDLQIAEAGAHITHDPLPAVYGDPPQISRVLQNLLSNALKYRKPDTPVRVEIRAMRQGDMWVLSVGDNGQGFDPDYTDEIFNLFKRTPGNSVAGTGIGLAICRAIVQRHGGKIWAEGHPAKGATFFFSLPALP